MKYIERWRENQLQNQSNQEDILQKLNFYRMVTQSVPVIIYLNEMSRDGDPLTCRNVWTNQFGLDYIGYTQDEIKTMGYDYLRNIVHPDDLSIVPKSLSMMSTSRNIPVFTGMHRVRTKHNPSYKWCYGFSVEIEKPAEYPFRQMLSAVFIISDDMHCMAQLTELLKEVGRLKNDLKLSALSKREMQVLENIAKGKSDNEISKKLFISLRTAKKHHNNILHKLSIHKTTELVALAIECGF